HVLRNHQLLHRGVWRACTVAADGFEDWWNCGRRAWGLLLLKDRRLVAPGDDGDSRQQWISRVRTRNARGVMGLRWLEQYADGCRGGEESRTQCPDCPDRRYDRRDADLLFDQPGLFLCAALQRGRHVIFDQIP